MLVLTRKAGETIQIGDSITISVVCVQKGRIKLGIEAPRDVAIRRGELAFESNPVPLPVTPTWNSEHLVYSV